MNTYSPSLVRWGRRKSVLKATTSRLWRRFPNATFIGIKEIYLSRMEFPKQSKPRRHGLLPLSWASWSMRSLDDTETHTCRWGPLHLKDTDSRTVHASRHTPGRYQHPCHLRNPLVVRTGQWHQDVALGRQRLLKGSYGQPSWLWRSWDLNLILFE